MLLFGCFQIMNKREVLYILPISQTWTLVIHSNFTVFFNIGEAGMFLLKSSP